MTRPERDKLRALCLNAPFSAARTDPAEAETFYRVAREMVPRLLDALDAAEAAARSHYPDCPRSQGLDCNCIDVRTQNERRAARGLPPLG